MITNTILRIITWTSIFTAFLLLYSVIMTVLGITNNEFSFMFNVLITASVGVLIANNLEDNDVPELVSY